MAPRLTAADLQHWLAFGGTVRALHVDGDLALVELCTCTGELVETRECAGAATIAVIRAAEAERE